MVTFSLLSDVKRNKLRAMRTKRLALLGCAVISCVSILFLASTWFILIGQRVVKSNISDEIQANYKQITQEKSEVEDGEVPRVNQLLTLQRNIDLINNTSLNMPVASRLFSFISEVNAPKPYEATVERVVFASGDISSLTPTTVTISGVSGTFLALNSYHLSLERAMFVSDQHPTYADAKKLFNSVEVIASSYNAQRGSVSWTISAEFNKEAFYLTTTDDDDQQVFLTGVRTFVPQGDILDSQEDVPVFSGKVANDNGGESE